jgi:hypothetical protein
LKAKVALKAKVEAVEAFKELLALKAGVALGAIISKARANIAFSSQS